MTTTWNPVKRSAVYRRGLSLGATMTDHYGWQVASHFISPESELRSVAQNAGLADVSWMGKLDLKGNHTDPTFALHPSSSLWLWRLARGHWMIICDPEEVETVQTELTRQAGLTSCFHITDATSAYSALILAGPKSQNVLNKATSLDLSDSAMPNLSSAQTELAHVHSMVMRCDFVEVKVKAYMLLISREYGEYVWDAMMHAGQEFDILPFGLAAHRILSGGSW